MVAVSKSELRSKRIINVNYVRLNIGYETRGKIRTPDIITIVSWSDWARTENAVVTYELAGTPFVYVIQH